MKRAAAVILLLALAAGAEAADKWYEAYDKGVAAVNSRNYRVAADLLQRSISEMPAEGLNVRAGRTLITYVPHFWLGIARFNLGDVDGAMRAWKTSEEQGVLARTEYYARMKDWVARAQTEKQRNAQDAASGPKKAADSAISKALEMQLGALSAGGDRSDNYTAAQRRLQEARTQFQKAGTDVNAYRAAEQKAQQAATLFGTAAEEGKKLKAARAATPAQVRKPTATNAQLLPAPKTAPPAAAPVVTETVAPPPPVITEAEARKRIEEAPGKQGNRPATAAKAPEIVPNEGAKASRTLEVLAPKETAAPRVDVRADLRRAYRAFASGELAASEQLLTGVLRAQESPEAYLLRGCARYTKAMLSRNPDALLLAATDDFRAALDRKSSLRLDRRSFSPKLVEFFEQVRERRR
jgi:hypothetical protein